MTFVFRIPRPEWGGDDQTAERGEHYGFQMYTREGNNAVARMIHFLVGQSHERRLRRDELIEALKEGVADVAESHPEVHDTEPEWAIVGAVNHYCDLVGFVRISRDDL